jgi:imidazolonepropionase-like amidohydrolase
MNPHPQLLLILGLAGCAGSPTPVAQPAGAQPTAPPLLLLDNLSVIDMVGSAARPGMSILVRGDRIAEIYPAGSKPVPPGARVVDLAGKFALPGLIDGHVHLTAPFTRTGQQDSLSEFFLRGGITTIRDMAGNGAVLRRRAEAARAGSTVTPRIFYSTVAASAHHFETDRRAASLTESGVVGQLDWARSVGSEADAARAAIGAQSIGATGIKAYAEMSAETIAALVREADKWGVKVWAHAALFPARPGDLVEAGVDVLSHAFMLVWEDYAAMPTEYSPSFDLYDFAGHPAGGSAFERLLQAMRRNGVMLDATLGVTQRLGRSQRVQDGDLAMMRGVDTWAVEITRRAHQAGVMLVAGTDVSGYPGRDPLPYLHDEIRTYVDEVGLTPLEALRSGTVNGAAAIGAGADLGTLEPGKLADLLILDGNPLENIDHTRRIHAVVKGGVIHRVPAPAAAGDSLQWGESWPGTQLAVVRGNPFGTGPFVFRFRMPAGYWIHPHTHPEHATIKVISGRFLVGMGTTLDSSAAKLLSPGEAIGLAGGMAHFEGTHGATEIEISGEAPWGITFLDPSKDPARPR